MTSWTPFNGTSPGSIEVVRGSGEATDGDAYVRLRLDEEDGPNGRISFAQGIRSGQFMMSAGQTVSVDFRPVETEDDTFVRILLYDASNNPVATLFDGTFDGEPGWQTVAATATSNGNYFITAQVGSFDETFGGIVGADLHLDNLRLGGVAGLTADIVNVNPNITSATISTLTVNFSRPVDPSTFSLADVSLSRGEDLSDILTGSETITWNDPQTVVIGGLESLTGTDGVYRFFVNMAGVSTPDPVGGFGNAFESWTRDTTPPFVTESEPDDEDPTNAQLITFEVEFSEFTTGGDISNFTVVTTGTLAGVSIVSVTPDGDEYDIEVDTGTGSGTIRIDVNSGSANIIDQASLSFIGGFNGGFVATIDRTAPGVDSLVATPASPTNSGASTYTLTFSEPVSGVDLSDFALVTTGTLAGASIVSVDGNDATYIITVNTGTGSGTLRLSLNSGSTDIADEADNAPVGGFDGELVTIDRTPPTIVSVARNTSISTPTNTVAFTVTFSEPVTGLELNDFLLATGGSVSGARLVSLSGSEAVYTVLVQVGSGSGTLQLNGQLETIFDLAGNPGSGEFSDGETINLPLANSGSGSIFSSVPGNSGSGTSIAVLDPLTGETRQGVVPFLGFNGQLDFTSADFNSDGFADLVVGAGANGGPRVVVLDAASGAMTASFFAFDERFRGGVEVASGDVTGDGVPDIIVAAGPGGGPHVRVFDGVTFQSVRSFFAFSENVQGGVRLAVADVDGDGKADIVAATGPGGGPQVRVFSGADGTLLSSFFAAERSFLGGVYVAAGDLDGDGRAEVIAGAGPGGLPWLKVFDGNNGTELRSTQPYRSDFRGGVRVLTTDADNDGRSEIVVGAGPGGGPHVQTLDGVTFQLLNSSYVFGEALGGGVSIG